MSRFPSKNTLAAFLSKTLEKTWAGGGSKLKKTQRPGFEELVYTEGDLSYRDSYTGNLRSHGTEVIRYKNKIIRAVSYRGGMVKGKERLSYKTYKFLKKALCTKDPTFNSARGPRSLIESDWEYKYVQEGDFFDEFTGYEKVYYKKDLVFYHRVIGGKIIH
jgi:hypothetical protein